LRLWKIQIEKFDYYHIVVIFSNNGITEDVAAGDLFYWPPGHTVKADADAESGLFSPQHEHTPVMDHINGKLGA